MTNLTDPCLDDADPGDFGIQVVVERAVLLSLHRQVLASLDLYDWFFNMGSRHERAYESGTIDTLDDLLDRVRPGFQSQLTALAMAVGSWIRVEYPSWLDDDEDGDYPADPFEALGWEAITYLVQILLIGIVPVEATVRDVQRDRLFADRVAKAQS